MRTLRRLLGLIGMVLAVLLILWIYLVWRPAEPNRAASVPVPSLNHVFIVVMENHSLDALSPQAAPYIHRIIQQDGYNSAYFGVTHVSLPNYAALIAGSTFHTHSDNPDQKFPAPTLVGELDARHITWQAVMQSLPYAGYRGNWYPERAGTNPVLMPKNALYAKKHNPFMLFPSIVRGGAHSVVPLDAFERELKAGRVPRFVWITPNLCADMHGQPRGSSACPSSNPQALVRDGNNFLAQLIPAITRSSAFRGHSVIFITWDESQMPNHLYSVAEWKQWLLAGPGAPRTLGVPIGGGSVPLIAIIPGGKEPPHIRVWADHYSLLKTIEAGFHLPYLGAAQSPDVPTLGALLSPRK
jgi:hypothetical protein